VERQARNDDTVVVMSREMNRRTQTLPRLLGGEEVKTTENKYIGPVGWECSTVYEKIYINAENCTYIITLV
jgi:hypothetical protein